MSVPYADNIIYNLSLYNDSPNTYQPAEKYVSRSQAFIDNVEDYYVRLIGADISTYTIPFFVYENDMTLTITNASTSITSLVSFPNSEYGIFFVNQFLEGVNTALTRSHTLSSAPGNAPLLIYDSDDRFKLVIDQLYDPTQNIIIFNENLSQKIPQLWYVTIRDNVNDQHQIIYKNIGNNMFNSYPGGISYPVYVMSSNALGYYSLQDFYSVLITTNTIPINRQVINNINNGAQTFGIIAVVSINFDSLVRQGILNFTQDTPIYSDLLDRGPLSNIDFKLYLSGKNFKITPLLLAPRSSITCRYQFTKKSLVKNYFPQGTLNLR